MIIGETQNDEVPRVDDARFFGLSARDPRNHRQIRLSYCSAEVRRARPSRSCERSGCLSHSSSVISLEFSR